MAESVTMIKVPHVEGNRNGEKCLLLPPCPSNCHLSVFFPFVEAVIKFGETKFSVTEPSRPGESVVVKIPVIRQGDTSKVSIVRVHTKDGSATSGEDYHPVSEGMGLPRVISWMEGAWSDLGTSGREVKVNECF